MARQPWKSIVLKNQKKAVKAKKRKKELKKNSVSASVSRFKTLLLKGRVAKRTAIQAMSGAWQKANTFTEQRKRSE